ncbi:hypothetical protein PR048_023199 [Dryococelus australis]|uniref:Uncharacterized protein n=1 Tax=Dryococelus australis TaxID=614101 RepID=A0ABQ9GTI8_9NEOP|nr:hypothetical protein PR048_023199 [Dryococelus australis]
MNTAEVMSEVYPRTTGAKQRMITSDFVPCKWRKDKQCDERKELNGAFETHLLTAVTRKVAQWEQSRGGPELTVCSPSDNERGYKTTVLHPISREMCIPIETKEDWLAKIMAACDMVRYTPGVSGRASKSSMHCYSYWRCAFQTFAIGGMDSGDLTSDETVFPEAFKTGHTETALGADARWEQLSQVRDNGTLAKSPESFVTAIPGSGPISDSLQIAHRRRKFSLSPSRDAAPERAVICGTERIT